MPSYTTHLLWLRQHQPFTDNRYSRAHRIEFDGGAVLEASSSPHVVRMPFSDPAAVDPEEMFVASLSSCHMLWFLSLAAARGFRVDEYHDAAEGVMTKNARGKLFMSAVTLRPEVIFSGEKMPDEVEYQALHHAAHEECFIANSVLTQVQCEAVMRRVK